MAQEEIRRYSCVLEATETTQEVDLPDNVPRSPSAHSLCQYCFVCMFAFCIQVVILRKMKLSPVPRPLQLRRPLPYKEEVGCQRTSDTIKTHVNRTNKNTRGSEGKDMLDVPDKHSVWTACLSSMSCSTHSVSFY